MVTDGLAEVAADPGDLHMAHFDISRAHFMPKVRRKIFVELPAEDRDENDQNGFVGQLNRTMYGTQDASNASQEDYSKVLLTGGYLSQAGSPALFFRAEIRGRMLVHGDDFILLATAAEIVGVFALLSSRYTVKLVGKIGLGCLPEFRVSHLEPCVKFVDLPGAARRVELEADQRHAELSIANAGLDSDSRPLTNPGRKLAGKELEEPDLLGAAAASEYRARAARANFLASDRPDVALAVKELCRRMSAPLVRCLVSL